LSGRYLLERPKCPCRDRGSCVTADELNACRLPQQAVQRLREEALAVATKPLSELFAANPGSAWLELARRFRRGAGFWSCAGDDVGKAEGHLVEPRQLLPLKTCRGDALASHDASVTVTASQIWVGDEPVVELDAGRLTLGGAHFADGVQRPLAQSIELLLRRQVGSPKKSRRSNADTALALNPAVLCAKRDLPGWQRLLYGCDSGPRATWRPLNAGEVAPLTCARATVERRSEPELPATSTQGPALLTPSVDAVRETVAAVFCAVAEAGHPVRIVGMPMHGPLSRPWDDPVACALPYPCAPNNETTLAECEAVSEALAKLGAAPPTSR
jgi:hypothetical protein